MMKYLLIFAIVFSAFILFLEQKSTFESAVDELVFLTLGEDTEVAPGYTDDQFRLIKPGDSESQVKALLGEPLQQSASAQNSWLAYSNSPTSTHYRQRLLLMRDGKVEQVVAGLYFD